MRKYLPIPAWNKATLGYRIAMYDYDIARDKEAIAYHHRKIASLQFRMMNNWAENYWLCSLPVEH